LKQKKAKKSNRIVYTRVYTWLRYASFVGLFFFLFLKHTTAQDNRRNKTISVAFPIQIIDSLTIIPNTVVITDSSAQVLDVAMYGVMNNKLVWKHRPNQLQYQVFYRVLPINVALPLSLLDSTQIKSGWGRNYIGYTFGDKKNSENGLLPDKKDGLDYSGALTRGISIGNNQDPVLNSRFNLNLSGKLSNDIEVNATLMDNNIPIQPDGTTQQLNQFDRIFIQLKRKNTILTAGDYDLVRPPSHFMNYYKRLQGGTLEHKDTIGRGFLSIKVSGALARGKFNRQQLQQQEGNQGPYRLQGAEGERFIIINAGTEKVYLDGKLLQRGLDDDYVMDYNIGTIVFTRKRIVTKDQRILVEFEYSDQNYVRSLMATNVSYKLKKIQFAFNAYSEQDGKNSGNAQSLTPSEKRALALAGDAAETAFSSGIDTLDAYNPDRVMYRYVDTLGQKVVLVSNNPSVARYTARFTEVQNGLGNYRLKQTGANGRVYEWVGDGQGNYIPFVKLAAPKQKQLYTLGADYQWNKTTLLTAEAALSKNDQNRFSRIDKADDVGLAGFVALQKTRKLKHNWSLQLNGKSEWTDQYFKALNPYRSAEFARDWNVPVNPKTKAVEWLNSASIGVIKKDTSRWVYEYSAYQREKEYKGQKHDLAIEHQYRNTILSSESSILQSTNGDEATSFIRPKVGISTEIKRLKKTKIGTSYEGERNSRLVRDTLARTSFEFQIKKGFIEIKPSSKWQINAQIADRQDFASKENRFQASTKSLDIGGNALYKLKNSSLNSSFTKRTLTVLDSTLSSNKPQKTYLGRLDYNFSLSKGAIRSSTSYELGSGQEQKIEYVYTEIRAGQGNGTFMWKDFNKDGQKQQNEFVVSPFPDSARFVRIVLPSNQFIRTQNLLFQQQLTLDPRAKWGSDTTYFKRFLSKLYFQSILKSNRRNKSNTVLEWQPWAKVNTNILVANTYYFHNTFIFNRLNPKYEILWEQNQNQQQNIYVTGFERRTNADDAIRLRFQLGKRLNNISRVARGRKASLSEFFVGNNYDIAFRQAETSLVFQEKNDFRLSINYKYNQSKDTIADIETATMNDLSIESTWTNNKTTFNVRGSYVAVAYRGSVGTPTEFALLNGLKNGRNLLWSLQLDRRINSSIFLNLSYSGRQTGNEGRIIHTAQMSVRAGF
jgi:hypothetical protein